MNKPETRDYYITVCDQCLEASCWYGEHLCSKASGAGTVVKKASELRALGKTGMQVPDPEHVAVVEGQVLWVEPRTPPRITAPDPKCQVCGGTGVEVLQEVDIGVGCIQEKADCECLSREQAEDPGS